MTGHRSTAPLGRPLVFAMSLACAVLVGAAMYLRLSEGAPLARVGLLVASPAMLAMMLRLVGRAGGGQP